MATIEIEQSEALTKKISSEVAALVRDLDAGEFSVRLTAQELLPVRLTLQHTAAFSIATAPGKGALAAEVAALDSMARLRAELEQRLHHVREEAGGLLDQWVAQEAGEYRRQLPPERCMVKRPVLGFQEVCGACHGHRQVTCGGCGGRGRHACGGCGGSGRVTCSSCGGSGQRMCGGCGGAGGHQEAYNEYRWDPQTQTGAYVFAGYRQVPCTGCGGSGRTSCSCSGGMQTCSGCNGGGQVTCARCGGSGIVPCDTCAASGLVHHTGWIQCTVSRDIAIEVTSNNPEDQETFRERIPFDQIGAMASTTGGVQLAAQERAGHRVTLLYVASVPLECAAAAFGGQSLGLRAYGPRREIYNYHGLVEKLLEQDLASLESRLQEDSLLKFRQRGSLAAVTKQFLASEMNALIAEAPPEMVEQESADKSAPRHVPIGRLIRNSLLLSPVRRLFRRSGIALKIILIVVALQIVSSGSVLLVYPFLAAICAYYERHALRNEPLETWKENAQQDSKQSDSAEVARALSNQIAVGLLSPQYLGRAGKAIGKAVPRLYGPLILPMGLWVTLGVTGLLLIGRLPFFPWTPNQAAAIVAVLTAVSWVLAERKARSHLQTMLSPKVYERVKGQFKKAQNLYRLLPAAGFLIGWYLANFILVLILALVAYLAA